MSGQQIGSVVGGVIGSFIPGVGTYLGMAIGGMIGGLVDPGNVSGPKIGDGQQQTSTDGAPIAWVQGTAMVAGTLAQASARRQVRHKTGGKGGPSQTTFTANQDFAIVICESCSLRGSTMSAVLMVIQDGKVVYDVRPGASAWTLNNSYKWKANIDFMFGDEAQLPHPTLEAITGVGNCPSYRGSLVMVAKNFDVSTPGNRIPSFQFVVVSNQTGTAASANTSDTDWAYQFVPTPAGAARPASISGSPSTWGASAAYPLPAFDDSAWPRGAGPYADAASAPGVGAATIIPSTATYGAGSEFWVRKRVSAQPGQPVTVSLSSNATSDAWWNGVYLGNFDVEQIYDHGYTVTVPGENVDAFNTIVFRLVDPWGGAMGELYMTTLQVAQTAVSAGAPTLDHVVSNIALRGGLSAGDIDVTALSGQTVLGYPIAAQMDAAAAISPVLSSYFAYGSEFDSKLRFAFAGANADVTIDPADLLEGSDANKGNIVSNLRNQYTEFPRRVVVAYIDPVQNYYPVYVAAERRASGVIATGDKTVQMPVVMPAVDGAQAADKALKCVYALLEGTLEFSVPFGGTATYLTLAAGAPTLFQGKRYTVADMILSSGYLKLTLQTDRQSAYTSVVQPIAGNAPAPSASPYSGPTTLIPMNLPAQRPQDTVGVYLVAASTAGSPDWRGCVVQVSYDAQASWVNACTITIGSELGQIDIAQPTGGEPLTVSLLSGALESATTAQLAANANGFAVTDSTGNVTQLGQFATATEVGTSEQYQITGVSRSLGGTASVPVAVGNPFTMMDAAYFLPIDPTFAGRTLYFRAVGFGELDASAIIVPLVYLALVQAPGVQRITENGTLRVAEDGTNLRLTEN